MSQRLIPTGERSGLQTHIATTESVSLCVRMKSLTAFVELECGDSSWVAVGCIVWLGLRSCFVTSPLYDIL